MVDFPALFATDFKKSVTGNTLIQQFSNTVAFTQETQLLLPVMKQVTHTVLFGPLLRLFCSKLVNNNSTVQFMLSSSCLILCPSS